MSTPAGRAEDLKLILRGLLISSPHAITVDQLGRDFMLQEGRNVPFHELGYPSFMKYLESIPDTVVIRPSLNGGSPIVAPVLSDKSAHIDSMVLKQKVHPPKRSTRIKHPAPCRSSVKATLQMSNADYSTNHNSSNMQQGTFIPASLQQRIYAMIHENPKGVPVQTIEKELRSSQMLQNYGIHEGCDIYHLLHRLDHLLKISNGMVYPLHNKSPPYRPIIQNPVTDNKISYIHDRQTYRFIPAGHEGEIDVCNQSCNVNVVNEFSAEKNEDDDADIAEALDKQAKVTEIVEDSFVSTTRSVTFDTEEDLKVSPGGGSPSDDTDIYTCDFASDLVSKKMRINFQTLLDKHPNGIWCSELPHLYKKEFAVVLEYTNFGFVSVMHMASNLPDVFHCIIVGGTEWKLFDARKKLPPEYATYNIKFNSYVSTEMVPTVPLKIRLNIKKLVAYYPAGLPSKLIPHLYEDEFLTTLNMHEMGFDSLETFLLALQQLSVLHLQCEKNKILVYPIAQETEPEKANPHIMEPQDHFLNLYPPEVVGPKGTLTHEKIPPEATRGGFIEVLVAEIYSPLNFWIHLRGENTHMALDRLMNDMQLFYQQEAGNYNMPEAAVRIGQYCVAPYEEEWHRACITAVHNFVDVQVLFVDYGTTYRVKKSKLRFLHMNYAQFPIQAIKASLANLVPVGGEEKWPCEASVRFLELVEDKNLIAIVGSVDHEARKLEVALVDTTGDEDIHINDVLVSMGLAEYKTERQASPLPRSQESHSRKSPLTPFKSPAAAKNISPEDSASVRATFDTHTETKEPPSVMSSGVRHLSVIVNSSPEKCTADVLCDEQLTAEAIASPKEVKASDDMLVAESCGLESESYFGFENQFMNEGREPGTDLSTISDEIYRSDDEDDSVEGKGVCEQQKQPTLRKSSYVKQIEIAGRVIHLISVKSTIFLCTEEVVKQFTDFSGRHVVLMIMDAMGVKIPFCEIERKDSHAIIDDLESYNVVGVPKSPDGYIIGKVHLTPLTSVTQLMPFFKVEDQEEICSVMESVTW